MNTYIDIERETGEGRPRKRRRWLSDKALINDFEYRMLGSCSSSRNTTIYGGDKGWRRRLPVEDGGNGHPSQMVEDSMVVVRLGDGSEEMEEKNEREKWRWWCGV